MTTERTKKTAHELATIIHDLQEKLEENSHRNSQLEARRAKVALAASQGDPAALDELDAIKADEALFSERTRNLTAAKEEAFRQHAVVAKEEGEARYLQNVRTAADLIKEGVEASAEIDRALADLAGPLGKRKAILDRLSRMNIESAERVSANLPGSMQSAFEAAGLPELFGQSARGIASYGTLAEFTKQNLQLSGQDRRLLNEAP